MDIEKLGAVGHWLFSGYDLSTSIRRINYGIGCLQSGAFLAGSQVGPLIKSTYENLFVHPDVKAHDSIRVTMFMTKIVREYLGEDFNWRRVMLSGSRTHCALYQDYSGCETGWNRTKVTFGRSTGCQAKEAGGEQARCHELL
ncbi:TPA: hypothetical protein ACGUPN_000377 [Vibrio vulnificus]|uniref:hypothetical protein n=1 Tax=Vibrio vulnificus TaxID=672 RepID=UPI002879EA52|nr:hypothetical protein [Vibrio vulnificus]MDS1829484.1 hypothetical protein [Vibrio vulnificus]